MYEDKFSKWLNWQDWQKRDNVSGITKPGIYIIAISSSDISDREFSWICEIKYIGMTNSIAGLKGRLKQFDNTIRGKRGHGGADRFRYQHQKYEELVQKLFVSIAPFDCNVKSNMPEDLRVMGKVAKFEYDCFACYVKLFNSLPEFNQKSSPKYSLTFERNKNN